MSSHFILKVLKKTTSNSMAKKTILLDVKTISHFLKWLLKPINDLEVRKISQTLKTHLDDFQMHFRIRIVFLVWKKIIIDKIYGYSTMQKLKDNPLLQHFMIEFRFLSTRIFLSRNETWALQNLDNGVSVQIRVNIITDLTRVYFHDMGVWG